MEGLGNLGASAKTAVLVVKIPGQPLDGLGQEGLSRLRPDRRPRSTPSVNLAGSPVSAPPADLQTRCGPLLLYASINILMTLAKAGRP